MKYGPSSGLGPVARVRQIYALYHETLSPRDMIALCVQEGINKNTATTQIHACRTRKKSEATDLYKQGQEELKAKMMDVLAFIKSGPDRHTKELWYTEAHSMLSLAAFREVQPS